MTLDEIKTRISNDLSRITSIPPESIGESTLFQTDLGLDSLSLLELVVDLEYAFGIKVPEEHLPGLQNVATVAQYVHDRLSAKA
jgi:acyl carrier protein